MLGIVFVAILVVLLFPVSSWQDFPSNFCNCSFARIYKNQVQVVFLLLCDFASVACCKLENIDSTIDDGEG